MTQNVRLTCTLAIGLLGGAILSHYVSPIAVFAQSLVVPNKTSSIGDWTRSVARRWLGGTQSGSPS